MQQVLKFIRRNKKNIYVLLVLSFLYFFTRLLFLMNLPIFNDEAIYLWWSKLSEKDLLIAVPLGRQPLFMWLIMIFSRFTADPLLGARLISVFAGFASMIGLFLLANELFRNKKNAFLTSLIYVFYPFAVVYDRLAIIDSLIGATAVWSLYITLILLKKRKIIYSILLGTILAIGIFAKTEGFLGIYLVPFSLIIFDFKKRKKYLLKTVGLLLLAVLISQALYSIVRYHPGYYRVLAVNGVIIYPAHDLLKLGINFIFQNFLKNLIVFTSFLIQYLKFPYLLLILISLIFIRDKTKEKILLLIYFLFPFLLLCLFDRVIGSRYIFFMTLPLLPLAAYSLGKITNNLKNKFSFLIVCLFLIYPIFISSQIIFNLKNSNISDSEIIQYGTSQGEWIKESTIYFQNQAKTRKIFIATEGMIGILPNIFQVYLNNNQNIKIKGFILPPNEVIPNKLEQLSKKMPVYFASTGEKNFAKNAHLKNVIEKEEKLKGLMFFYRVYQVIPN